MDKKIKCCCKNLFNKNQFENHFKKCELFKQKFKQFDTKLVLLLKEFKNIEDLNYVKYLLKSFIKLIDSKLKSSKDINSFQNVNTQNIINNKKFKELNIKKSFNNNSYIIEKLPSKNEYHYYSNYIFQSFFSLNSIKNWYNIKSNDIGNKNESSLEKKFYEELKNFYNYKIINFQNIINEYESKYKFLFNTNLPNEPSYFINYFIEFLINYNPFSLIRSFKIYVKNSNNIENDINNEYKLIYEAFSKKTKNRMCHCFFNIIRNIYICECNESPDIIDFYKENVITLDLSSSQQQNNKLDLDTYLKKYSSQNLTKCKYCGNKKVRNAKKIFLPSEILIIYFKRFSHTYKCDVSFPIDLELNNYTCLYTNVSLIKENKFNLKYSLKSCISCKNDNKYIAYIYINNNWYKFFDDKKTNINNTTNEIYEFEPQILIYEVMENKLINNFDKNLGEKYSITFILIPDNFNINFQTNEYETITNIFNQFNRQVNNEYKLFICNTKKVDPKSNITLREFVKTFKITTNIQIFAIKGI